MLIIFIVLLLETAMAADILLNSDWEKVNHLSKQAYNIPPKSSVSHFPYNFVLHFSGFTL